MRSSRLNSVRVRYWLLGTTLLLVAFASIVHFTKLLGNGKLATVASNFGEGQLNGGVDNELMELRYVEELYSGDRSNVLCSAKKLQLLLFEPFDRRNRGGPFMQDCDRLPVMPKVEQIRIAVRHVRNFSSLRRHPRLSRILLDSVELVDDNGQVLDALESSDLPDKLEVLRIQRSSIRDVSRLSHMRQLKCLNLCLTEVEKLPIDPMPRLKEIHLIGCRNVTASELARFSRLNPNCKVRYGWRETLVQDLKYADHVAFPSGEVRGRKDVEKLLALIDVDENAESFRPLDPCKPYVFYQGKRKIGRLWLDYAIAWEYWPEETKLTRLSLLDLQANGY